MVLYVNKMLIGAEFLEKQVGYTAGTMIFTHCSEFRVTGAFIAVIMRYMDVAGMNIRIGIDMTMRNKAVGKDH